MLLLAWIHLQSLSFCMEMHAGDPSTFVGNEVYHFEEEVKLNLLALSLTVRIGQRPPFHVRVYSGYYTHLSLTPLLRLSSNGDGLHLIDPF